MHISHFIENATWILDWMRPNLFLQLPTTQKGYLPSLAIFHHYSPFVIFERDPPAEHLEKLVHSLAVTPVPEQLLFACLAVPLVDEAELEVVD